MCLKYHHSKFLLCLVTVHTCAIVKITEHSPAPNEVICSKYWCATMQCRDFRMTTRPKTRQPNAYATHMNTISSNVDLSSRPLAIASFGWKQNLDIKQSLV